MKATPLPPLDYLHTIFDVDPEIGKIVWKVRLSIRVWPGKPAGRLNNRGYLRVGINGTCYLVHRIMYYMATTTDPGDLQIDHVNGDRLDNRISNLRVADNAENNRNKGKPKSNSSGYKGVCLHKASGTYRTYITVKGKQHSLGYYATVEEAAEVVRKARVSFEGEFTNHG